jgi:protein required for attachment to host cells
VRESVGGARHAIEPRQDPHEAAERAFARGLADRLEAAAAAGRFERLILVAPPKFLGHLRAALGGAAGPRLRGSLDLDLTHAPLAEIVARLPVALGPADRGAA